MIDRTPTSRAKPRRRATERDSGLSRLRVSGLAETYPIGKAELKLNPVWDPPPPKPKKVRIHFDVARGWTWSATAANFSVVPTTNQPQISLPIPPALVGFTAPTTLVRDGAPYLGIRVVARDSSGAYPPETYNFFLDWDTQQVAGSVALEVWENAGPFYLIGTLP